MFDFIKPSFEKDEIRVRQFINKFKLISFAIEMTILMLMIVYGFVIVFGFISNVPPVYNSFEDFSVLVQFNSTAPNNGAVELTNPYGAGLAYYRPAGELVFQSRDIQLVLVKYINIYFVLGLLFALFRQLYKLACSLENKISFSKELAKSARSIGKIFFVGGFLSGLYHLLKINEFVSKNYFYSRFTSQKGTISVYPDFQTTWGFATVALIILSMIFITFSLILSYGTKLQEENDLTV